MKNINITESVGELLRKLRTTFNIPTLGSYSEEIIHLHHLEHKDSKLTDEEIISEKIKEIKDHFQLENDPWCDDTNTIQTIPESTVSIDGNLNKITIMKNGLILIITDADSIYNVILGLATEYLISAEQYIDRYRHDIYEMATYSKQQQMEYLKRQQVIFSDDEAQISNNMITEFNNVLLEFNGKMRLADDRSLMCDRNGVDQKLQHDFIETAIIKSQYITHIGCPVYVSVLSMLRLIFRLVTHDQRNMFNDVIDFVHLNKMPITVDGEILAIKKVNSDLTSPFDSKTRNIPGTILSVDDVDWNKSHECSQGLHVGCLSYVTSFSGKVYLAVLVAPEDIVAVPMHDHMKMRCVQYKILGIIKPSLIGSENSRDIFAPEDHSPKEFYGSVSDKDILHETKPIVHAVEVEQKSEILTTSKTVTLSQTSSQYFIDELYMGNHTKINKESQKEITNLITSHLLALDNSERSIIIKPGDKQIMKWKLYKLLISQLQQHNIPMILSLMHGKLPINLCYYITKEFINDMFIENPNLALSFEKYFSEHDFHKHNDGCNFYIPVAVIHAEDIQYKLELFSDVELLETSIDPDIDINAILIGICTKNQSLIADMTNEINDVITIADEYIIPHNSDFDDNNDEDDLCDNCGNLNSECSCEDICEDCDNAESECTCHNECPYETECACVDYCHDCDNDREDCTCKYNHDDNECKVCGHPKHKCVCDI